MLHQQEHAQRPASSPSRPSRPRRGCAGGSGLRRAFHARQRGMRRGSDCRKSLLTPGSDRVEGQDRGGPLFYAQYTSTDTGLIYLRARVYDPATAQFLSRDPLALLTRQPYAYTEDNPLNLGDPTGLWSPTESLEKFSNEIGEEIGNVSGGLINGLTGGLIEGSGNACSTGYEVGEYGSLLGALLPEDVGPQIFQQLARRYPKIALFLFKQQANQQLTQPGKLAILKATLEKLLHLLGG